MAPELGNIILHLAAAGAVYFLVSMILALVRDEPQATLRAWGLGVCIVLMMVATMLGPATSSPADGPTPGGPTRGPDLPPRIPGLWQVAPARAERDPGVLDPL